MAHLAPLVERWLQGRISDLDWGREKIGLLHFLGQELKEDVQILAQHLPSIESIVVDYVSKNAMDIEHATASTSGDVRMTSTASGNFQMTSTASGDVQMAPVDVKANESGSILGKRRASEMEEGALQEFVYSFILENPRSNSDDCRHSLNEYLRREHMFDSTTPDSVFHALFGKVKGRIMDNVYRFDDFSVEPRFRPLLTHGDRWWYIKVIKEDLEDIWGKRRKLLDEVEQLKNCKREKLLKVKTLKPLKSPYLRSKVDFPGNCLGVEVTTLIPDGHHSYWHHHAMGSPIEEEKKVVVKPVKTLQLPYEDQTFLYDPRVSGEQVAMTIKKSLMDSLVPSSFNSVKATEGLDIKLYSGNIDLLLTKEMVKKLKHLFENILVMSKQSIFRGGCVKLTSIEERTTGFSEVRLLYTPGDNSPPVCRGSGTLELKHFSEMVFRTMEWKVKQYLDLQIQKKFCFVSRNKSNSRSYDIKLVLKIGRTLHNKTFTAMYKEVIDKRLDNEVFHCRCWMGGWVSVDRPRMPEIMPDTEEGVKSEREDDGSSSDSGSSSDEESSSDDEDDEGGAVANNPATTSGEPDEESSSSDSDSSSDDEDDENGAVAAPTTATTTSIAADDEDSDSDDEDDENGAVAAPTTATTTTIAAPVVSGHDSGSESDDEDSDSDDEDSDSDDEDGGSPSVSVTTTPDIGNGMTWLPITDGSYVTVAGFDEIKCTECDENGEKRPLTLSFGTGNDGDVQYDATQQTLKLTPKKQAVLFSSGLGVVECSFIPKSVSVGNGSRVTIEKIFNQVSATSNAQELSGLVGHEMRKFLVPSSSD